MDKYEFFRKIEDKWQKVWEEKKVFEANPDNRPKFFLTFPYPYLNGLLHLGHAFTSARTEFLARYKRLKGYNVLWPQGWHVTGAPIVAAAYRLRKGDPKIIRDLVELMHVPPEELEKFEDPEYWIKYFAPKAKEAFRRMGYSIDWRREFHTTYLNPNYSKFIEWQYLKLKEKGLITKGKHPVVWDPKVNKVIGDHDRPDEYAGIGPIEGYIIKFKLEGSEVIFPCFTLRPETVYGVTNIWISPETEYAIYRVNEEQWVLPKTIVIEELKNQGFNVEYIKDVDVKELLGKFVINPVTNEKVPILPAKFVDPEVGTGIVMSVPAHAPYDYIALKDLVLEFEDYKGIKVNKKVLEETKEIDNEIKNLDKIAIAAALITDGERVYLVKRAPWKKALANRWFFVGGRLEEGENIIDALIREVKEETKSEIQDIVSYLGYIDYEEAKVYVFLVTLKSKPSLDRSEHVNELWLKLDDVKGYDISEEVRRIIEKAKDILFNFKFLDLAKEALKSMRSLFKLEGFSEFPAKDIVERMQIKSQEDKEKLEKATQEIYSKEFYNGILGEIFGKYAGKKICEVKDELAKEFVEKRVAVKYYTLPIRFESRYKNKVIVKIVEDQWFIRYSDSKWKKLAHECVDQMNFVPEEIRREFHNVIDWLNDWAFTHKEELGTYLPWDPEWVIESLSDSTIYMAYYTIAHHVQKLKPEQLVPELFDYIFLGKGDLNELSKKIGIDRETIQKMREEFNYWYPLDMRISAKDLIPNHLTFLIFHHAAIFPREKWPKGIAVNGWVLINGERMSKSKGNFIPILDALNKYSADILRFILAYAGNSGLDDCNIELSLADKIADGLKEWYDFCINNYNKGREEKLLVDQWFENILYKILKEVEEEYEKLNYKNIINKVWFELDREFKWYLRRVGNNPNIEVINRYIEFRNIMLYPIIPHLVSEIFERIGKDPLNLRWPEVKKVDEKIILLEEYIRELRDDITKIMEIIKKKEINEIKIIIAKDEKYKIFKEFKKLLSEKKLNEIIREMASKYREYSNIILKIGRDLGLLKFVFDRGDEIKALKEAKNFFEKEFNVKVIIELEEESREAKAKNALPGKPAIVVR